MKKMFMGVAYCLGIMYVFASGMLLFGVTGSAYIDPSVMTYLIQIIAGVVVAVGAVVGVYWRRAKKKVKNTLGIEEKKERESDEIIINDDLGAESADNGEQR